MHFHQVGTIFSVNYQPFFGAQITANGVPGERAAALGTKGRERMLASFSISAMAQGNVNVYHAVMAARSEA